jgi:hypothetical protein
MPENLGVVSDYEPASELSRSTQPWVALSNVEQLAAWDGDAGARRAHRSGRPGAQDERHSCSILNSFETRSPTNAGTR